MTFYNAAAPEVILPPGRRYWTDETFFNPKKQMPQYRPGQVAAFFFGRGWAWLHKRTIQEHPEIMNGLDVGRVSGMRMFRLHEVEQLANELVEHGVIDGSQFLYAVALVQLQARVWGFGDKIDAIALEARSVRDV